MHSSNRAKTRGSRQRAFSPRKCRIKTFKKQRLRGGPKQGVNLGKVFWNGGGQNNKARKKRKRRKKRGSKNVKRWTEAKVWKRKGRGRLHRLRGRMGKRGLNARQ